MTIFEALTIVDRTIIKSLHEGLIALIVGFLAIGVLLIITAIIVVPVIILGQGVFGP
jgi:hypothetical protein